ncbi:MAG TPA: VOC family protein [Pyrinomonadaceae bacterium]|nr:VOC family protein [Pyrinomonadaceae bacterium]
MQEQMERRFEGAVLDHIAVKSEDVGRDAAEYERIGFRVETLYDDWAMLRDARGFGIALLAPGSKHPPHMGLRVETREALEEAARREGRPVKEHRDRSVSFYTKGVGGNAVEVIYYPPEYQPG